MPVNTDAISSSLLDNAKDNINNGLALTKKSIYDKTGKMDFKALEELHGTVVEIARKYDKDNEVATDPSIIKNFSQILKGIGFNISEEQLLSLFRETPKSFNTIITDILSITEKGKEHAAAIKNNPDTPIYSTFGSYYKNIAKALSSVVNEEVPTSYRENGKVRNSFTPKSFLGNLKNRLSNATGYSEEKYMNWINEHYLKYKWFSNNGVILNGWLNDLINGTPEDEVGSSGKTYTAQQLRKEFDFCVLHNRGKINYEWLS